MRRLNWFITLMDAPTFKTGSTMQAAISADVVHIVQDEVVHRISTLLLPSVADGCRDGCVFADIVAATMLAHYGASRIVRCRIRVPACLPVCCVRSRNIWWPAKRCLQCALPVENMPGQSDDVLY